MLQEKRRSGLAEQAYEHIKAQFLDGRYKANIWLPVEEIVAEIGTSRQPVMDAMKRLAMEGYVEIVPQVGTRIIERSIQEIHDFYRFFAAGEALSAELVAERASPNDVVTLRLISAQIGELSKLGAGSAEQGRLYRLLNRRLHGEIRKIMKSPALATIMESMGDRSDFYISVSNLPVFAQNLKQAQAEHEEIIDAIAKGDAAAARKAMEEHILATESRLVEALSKADEPKTAKKRKKKLLQ